LATSAVLPFFLVISDTTIPVMRLRGTEIIAGCASGIGDFTSVSGKPRERVSTALYHTKIPANISKNDSLAVARFQNMVMKTRRRLADAAMQKPILPGTYVMLMKDSQPLALRLQRWFYPSGKTMRYRQVIS
jgi:hypothetical protein